MYYCYWIVSDNASYIGATVDPTRRLRQHCGEIVGGARRTRGRQWRFQCVISGFRTWRETLQFEWAAKFYSKRCRSVRTRRVALEALLQKERWTTNAPPSCEVPLSVEWEPSQYGFPLEDAPLEAQPRAPRRPAARRRFKKRLHGVTY